jgi:hypothetical protein
MLEQGNFNVGSKFRIHRLDSMYVFGSIGFGVFKRGIQNWNG